MIGAYLLLEVCEMPFRAHRSQALQQTRAEGGAVAGRYSGSHAVESVGNPSASYALAGLSRQQHVDFTTLVSSEEFLPYKLSFYSLQKLLDFRYHENGFL